MKAEDVNHLIDLIKEHVDQIEDQEQIKEAVNFFNNTKEAVKIKAETIEKYKAIKLS